MSAVGPVARRAATRLTVAVVFLLGTTTSGSAQPVPPVRLNVSTAGAQANGSSFFDDMTPDGRVVVFESSTSNLVDGDTNGQFDIFLRDRDTDRDGVLDEPGAVRTIRLSQGPAGEQPGVITGTARVSRDGRFVFWSTSAALVTADTNNATDGYLYDRDVDADGVFDEPGSAGLALATTLPRRRGTWPKARPAGSCSSTCSTTPATPRPRPRCATFARRRCRRSIARMPCRPTRGSPSASMPSLVSPARTSRRRSPPLCRSSSSAPCTGTSVTRHWRPVTRVPASPARRRAGSSPRAPPATSSTCSCCSPTRRRPRPRSRSATCSPRARC